MSTDRIFGACLLFIGGAFAFIVGGLLVTAVGIVRGWVA